MKNVLHKKSVASSAGKAASGVFGGHRAARQGSKTPMKSGKGHFAAAAQRVAKMRSGHLQHGVPKHAPMGAIAMVGGVRPPNSKKVQASPDQTALNPKQQGATTVGQQTESEDE